MPKSRTSECRKTPCHKPPNSRDCELNNLIRKFRLEHQCPCYSCLVKTICRTLCKDYTKYVDPIFFKEYDDLYFIEQEDKYEPDGKVTHQFLSLLVDRITHYRPHNACYVELDRVEYEDKIEYSTAQILLNQG